MPPLGKSQFSPAKRQREEKRAKKQEEKAARRQERRDRPPEAVSYVSARDIVGDLPSTEDAMRAMQERSSAPRAAAPMPARLFVGGLDVGVTSEMLRQAFASCGEVADAFVVTDRMSGVSRGFGFVTMVDRKDAPKAIAALDGTELAGRRIAVNVATEKPGR